MVLVQDIVTSTLLYVSPRWGCCCRERGHVVGHSRWSDRQARCALVKKSWWRSLQPAPFFSRADPNNFFSYQPRLGKPRIVNSVTNTEEGAESGLGRSPARTFLSRVFLIETLLHDSPQTYQSSQWSNRTKKSILDLASKALGLTIALCSMKLLGIGRK